ncbi:hypothetical protein AWB67_06544 [Caballeronia terrestris]|uniref:Uncharacterized protein n=1 Tax=Caballeronia terrestris TaxID=1226301 RepID=A0A158KTA0_9BURK|nr:hypothetical protein AWB67_06544 [Caballeronia terrestris]
MYGYKAATYPVKSEHKKTWRIGGVHINYVDAASVRQTRKNNPGVAEVPDQVA